MLRLVILSLMVASLAIALRLPVLQKVQPDAFGAENDRVARSLAQGHGWSDAYAPGTGPTAHVSPLYPLLLQSLYRVFGTFESATGRLAQQYCSLGVSIAVILLLPAVARKLNFPSSVGWAAAFLVAWLPAHRWHQVVGFEQSLGALMLFALIWSCASLRESDWRRPRTVVTMGTVLGLSALACPNLLLAPVLFFIVEFLGRKGERARVLLGCLAVAAVSSAVVAPWAVRNWQVLGGFVPLRSNLGLELAIGNRPGADGRTYAPGFYDLHPLGSASERDRLLQIGELAYMKEKQSQSLAWIADNPAAFTQLTLRRASLFWFSPNERWYSLSPQLLLPARIYGLLGVCLLLELARLLRARHPAGPLLACFAVGIGAPYFITHVEVRYTIPFTHLAALATCNLVLILGKHARSHLDRAIARRRSKYPQRAAAWSGPESTVPLPFWRRRLACTPSAKIGAEATGEQRLRSH